MTITAIDILNKIDSISEKSSATKWSWTKKTKNLYKADFYVEIPNESGLVTVEIDRVDSDEIIDDLKDLLDTTIDAKSSWSVSFDLDNKPLAQSVPNKNSIMNTGNKILTDFIKLRKPDIISFYVKSRPLDLSIAEKLGAELKNKYTLVQDSDAEIYLVKNNLL